MSQALINGVEYSLKDLRIQWMGQVVPSVSELNYDYSQEVKENYGASEEPVSVSVGEKKYSGDITIGQKDLLAMEAASKKSGYQDLTGFFSDITIVALPNNGNPGFTHILEKVRIKKVPRGWKTGAEQSVAKLDLFIGKINV